MLIYLLRLTFHTILACFQSRVSADEVFHLTTFCLPVDVNLLLRMTPDNAVRVFEYARSAILVRFGLLGHCLRREVAPVLANTQFTISGPLPRLGQKYHIRTVTSDMDSEAMYILQELLVDGEVVCKGVLRCVFLTKDKSGRLVKMGSAATLQLIRDQKIGTVKDTAAHFEKWGVTGPGGVTDHSARYDEFMQGRETEDGFDFSTMLRQFKDEVKPPVTELYHRSDQAVWDATFE